MCVNGHSRKNVRIHLLKKRPQVSKAVKLAHYLFGTKYIIQNVEQLLVFCP